MGMEAGGARLLSQLHQSPQDQAGSPGGFCRAPSMCTLVVSLFWSPFCLQQSLTLSSEPVPVLLTPYGTQFPPDTAGLCSQRTLKPECSHPTPLEDFLLGPHSTMWARSPSPCCGPRSAPVPDTRCPSSAVLASEAERLGQVPTQPQPSPPARCGVQGRKQRGRSLPSSAWLCRVCVSWAPRFSFPRHCPKCKASPPCSSPAHPSPAPWCCHPSSALPRGALCWARFPTGCGDLSVAGR